MNMANTAPAQDPRQTNAFARDAVLNASIDMWQSVFSTTLQGSAINQVVNIPVRNVGLIKRFVVEVTCTVAQSAAETLTRTMLGPANIFSNITFTDLSNQTRVNTTGWHMHLL